MALYSSLADEYYVNLALRTALPLPQSRETILGLFASLQKAFPSLTRFNVREGGEVILESEKSEGRYSWFVMEREILLSGYLNPEAPEHALEQHRRLLELVPYHLSINHLDVNTLDLTVGFDFYYRGNQHELVAEALGSGLLESGLSELSRGRKLVSFEPDVTFALDEEAKLLCRVSVEPRTTLYQIRSGEYGEEPISVWFSLRRYGPLAATEPLVDVLDALARRAFDMIDAFLVPTVVEPLARTIASRQ